MPETVVVRHSLIPATQLLYFLVFLPFAAAAAAAVVEFVEGLRVVVMGR